MRGLKTQEGKKFEHFWELVQTEAQKLDCVFFLDCGEGREIHRDSMDGEDLSGWLIPLSDADIFESAWKDADKIPLEDKWASRIRFAIWSEDAQGIHIAFQEF
ncbi:hypothetical protein DWV16_16260 [Anaerotruncus sp. AF02-27]|uniref:hypothetical protein n=1 Tax=Anaerotruncus TaxID=244127 RepID=UPI000E475F73|nr:MULTISPECIES: hypothetical protein [Anaerotruncus]RGX53779.1 hypothetical protein DWV16_16260 [Anaerotruncus sp. AF02-27]